MEHEFPVGAFAEECVIYTEHDGSIHYKIWTGRSRAYVHGLYIPMGRNVAAEQLAANMRRKRG